MAVYTEVNPDQLNGFAAGYDLGRLLAFKGIAEGVENSNYLLQAESGSYILTLYEKRVKAGDLPYFLDLMEHLAARGVKCPVPVADRDGRKAQELCGRPAAVVSFLTGVPIHQPTPENCAELGRAAAGLHRAGTDFPLHRSNALSISGWRPLVDACLDGADRVAAGLSTLIAEELDFLERQWPTALPQGVIHADLFPDNVFFIDGKLSGIIDFYFACNDFLAYELGVCLNAWCFDGAGSFVPENGRALLEGYRKSRPLSAPECAALPILARGAALRFLLTRLYDWLNQVDGALVRRKDPLEYVPRLEFHRSAKAPADYGLL